MATRAGKPATAPKKTEDAPPPIVEKKKRVDTKLITIMFLLALLFAGASVATVYFVTNIQFADFFEKTPKPKDFLGPTYKLGDFISNLSGGGRRYIKVSITAAFAFEKNFHAMVETEKAKVIGEIRHDIDPLEPVLKDTINGTLAKLTPSEVTGAAGHEFLKKTLLTALNAKLKELMPKYEIKEVYLPEIVVQ